MDEKVLKNIWEALSSDKVTSSDFETWKANFIESEEVQANVHEHLKSNQYTDNDYNTWSKNVGIQGGGSQPTQQTSANPTAEQPKPESTEREILEAANSADNQDWWEDNQDLGSFDGYVQNEDGNWALESDPDKAVLWKDKKLKSEWGSTLTADGSKAKALAEQLEKQSAQRSGRTAGIKATEDIKEDPAEIASKNLRRKETAFFDNNLEKRKEVVDGVEVTLEPIEQNDWELVSPGVIKKGNLKVTKDSLPSIPGKPNVPDERYLELIDILTEKGKQALDVETKAKDAGSNLVSTITAENLEKRNWLGIKSENKVLDWFGNNSNLVEMGFSVSDEKFEFGAGELTITSNFDKEKSFKIKTGGGASAEDVENLNLFLKANAQDMGAGALGAHMANSGVTVEQAKNNKAEAALETANMAAKQQLRKNEDRDLEDKVHSQIMNDAVIAVTNGKYSTLEEYENSPEYGKAGKSFKRQKANEEAIMDWVNSNLINYPEAIEAGFKVKDESSRVMMRTGAAEMGGTLALYRTYKLEKGYEVTEEFLEENSEDAKTFNAAVDREAKRQFIENINDALGKENQLSSADADAIMSASADEIEGFRNLPESVVDAIDTSKVSFSEIRRGINQANENVISEVESALVQPKNAESVKKNVYENVEAGSTNWWSREKWVKGLEAEAATRWDEVQAEYKTIVGASQELRGEFEHNVTLLEGTFKELNELRFDGLTTEEALDKISKGTYNTKEEADAARAKAREIANTHNAISGKLKAYVAAHKTYIDLTVDMREDLDDLSLESRDLSWYKDVIGDNTALGFQAADALLNGIIEIGQGLGELGGITADVLNHLVSGGAGLIWGEEANENMDAWYSETAFGDRRVQHAIDDWQARGVMGVKAQETVRMGDVDSWGDVAEWGLVTLASQAPQLAMMYATGGLGSLATKGAVTAGTMTAARAAKIAEIFSLSTMGGMSMGTKYKEMREENELYRDSNGLYGQEYSLGQMLLVSTGTGVVEALSEKITYDLMKGTAGAFSKSARNRALLDMKEGFGKYVRKEFFSAKGMGRSIRSLGMTAQEGLSEGVATIGANFFDQMGRADSIAEFKEGVSTHIFDDVAESVVTGAMIGGLMSTTAIYARVINPFRSINMQAEQGALHARDLATAKTMQELIAEGASDEAIKSLADEQVAIQVELAQLKELETKRVDVFTGDEKTQLINLDKANNALMNTFQRAYADVGRNEMTREELDALEKDLDKKLHKNKQEASKIIDKYNVNMVNKKYERFIKRTQQLEAYARSEGGVSTTTKEHGTKEFADFVAKHSTNEKRAQHEAELSRWEGIAEDTSKTDAERSVARENANSISNFIEVSKSKDVSGTYGAMIPIYDPGTGKLDRFEVGINKNKAKLDNKFATATHEFQHTVLHNTIKQDVGVQDLIGVQISELVNSDETTFTKDKNGNSHENEYWGRVFSYEAKGRGEEQLTVFSEMMDEGKVKFTDGMGKKLGRYVRHIQTRIGQHEITFDNKEGIKDFITTYHRTVNARFGGNIGLEKMKREGAGGKLIDQGRASTQKAKHADMRGKISFSKAVDIAESSNPDLKQTFDKHVQNADGSRKFNSKEELSLDPAFTDAYFDIVEGRALDGLIQQGMTELGLPAVALREFTRKVKEKLGERYLKNFDPGKNESLFGWLTGVSGGRGESIIYRAKGDVMLEYSKEIDTVSLDAPMGEGQSFADTLADDTTVSGDAANSISLNENADGLTVFLDSINASPKVVKAINKVVADANIDITGLTYKDVKKLVTGKNAPLSGILNIVSEDFGVPPAKIIKPADLNTVERTTAQQFIKDKSQALLDMLPEGQNQSGMATGVANTKLGSLYVKGKRVEVKKGAAPKGGQKYAQNKRQDITTDIFNSLFGINPDGTFDNNRKHDGAIKALVNQAAMITANQTIRQQAIENASDPLSKIAMIGEGKGLMMYSVEGKLGNVGKLGRMLPELGRFVFLGRTTKLAENILAPLTVIENDPKNQTAKNKFSQEAIRGAVLATYRDLFTPDQLKNLVYAIHDIAVAGKIKKTDKGRLSRKEALTLQLDKLMDPESNTSMWFGTGVTNASLYNSETVKGKKKIKEHRGHAMKFHTEEVTRAQKDNGFKHDKDGNVTQQGNNLDAGIDILRSMNMLRQQMSTAGVVGGKRAQLYRGKEWLEISRDNTPGLEFQIKESANKKGVSSYSIDFSKPVTYNGQVLEVSEVDSEGESKVRPLAQKDISLDPQTSVSVIDQVLDDMFSGTSKVNGRAEGVKEAREHLNNYVAYHVRLQKDGITSDEDLQMVAANLLSNMNPSLARAAMPKFVGEDLLPPNWKQDIKGMTQKEFNNYKKKVKANMVGDLKPRFEHMQPRLAVVLGLFNAHLFEGGVTDVDVQFANYDVAIISDRMDKGVTAAGYQNSLVQGQTLDMASWIRYYNEATMATGKMVGLIGVGNNAGVDIGNAYIRAAGILNHKRKAMKDAAIANGMLVRSRSITEGTKGISALDFDDTLATTKSNVLFTRPDGTKGKLNAEEFAKQGGDLLAQGVEFDFSEFNKVVDGKTAPLFTKALKLAGKFGTKDMFVVTARSAMAAQAIKQFLDSQGLSIPIENIVGLGKSEASAKADWIAGKIGEGYNDFYFADDAKQNVDAVKETLTKAGVKGKVQQAKADFDKSDALTADGTYDSIMFSKSHRAEYEGILSKSRPDLVKDGLVSKTVDNMFTFIDTLDVREDKKRKYEKVTTKWLATSNIKLVEDRFKIIDAIDIAERFKLDIFSYNNPNEIIEAYAGKTTKKPLDPNKVPEFGPSLYMGPTNKKYGITEHVVEDTREGQKAVRDILDSHWGEKSNPWCITQKKHGKLTEGSWDQWESYSDKPKSILFQDGKLLAFKANGLHWDRMDNDTKHPVVNIKEGRVTTKIELRKGSPSKIERVAVSEDGKTTTTEYLRDTNAYSKGYKTIEERNNGRKIKVTVVSNRGVKSRVTTFGAQGLITGIKGYDSLGWMSSLNTGVAAVAYSDVEMDFLKKEGDIASRERYDSGVYTFEGTILVEGEARNLQWRGKDGKEGADLKNVTHEVDGKTRLDLKKILALDPNAMGIPGTVNAPTGFRFSKAMQNDKGIRSLLEQYDVKGKVQQAKLQFSRQAPQRISDIIGERSMVTNLDISADLNTILEETKGVEKEKRFSPAKARQRGKNKGRFKFFVPPSADDFAGLMYYFLGKGKQGEQHHAWFKKHLFDPFSKGIRHLNTVKQAVTSDLKALKKIVPEVRKALGETVKGTEYTNEDAIRVYNWDKAGLEIPGLSKNDKILLLRAVNNSPEFKGFADSVTTIAGQAATEAVKPGDHWLAGTISSDLNDVLNSSRKNYLKEWIANKNIMFSPENLNKIEAVYGSNFREALEDILFRMERGGNQSRGNSRLLNNFTSWIHGSIGTTMFFNSRTAVLQMISNVNFVNWSDNNMLAAAKAFANQPQYWSDVSMIFNSPFLQQRRSGLQTDVNASELLTQIQGSKNKMKAATAYLLQLGFTPTQIADSLAIATGGATMYRNRVNSYLKDGMAKAEAETKAFEDMMEIAEETQQSSREDRISQQQASPLGKFILAFQNTPMQYNRLIKKAAMDLVNGRGDPKANVSRIVYYGGIQNMIFYGLQQALFAALFGDDEEDEITDKQKERVLNGMTDTILRGSGILGAIIATVKNVIIRGSQEAAKMDDDSFFTNPDWGNVVIEALNISPPIGIKARKIHGALKTWEYNRDVINHMDKTDIDNPMYDAMFSATEAVTNLPLSRLYSKYQNISESMNNDHETWKRVAMALGWSKWNFGIKNQDVITAKGEVKEIKAAEAEERRETKKKQRVIEKEAEDALVIEENIKTQEKEREDGQEDIKCAAVNKSGNRCGTVVKGGGNYCTIHEEVEQNAGGEKSQCSHVKANGDQCKMQTSNQSGKCYYHD